MSDISIALVTARKARGTDYDMPPLLDAVRATGADVHEIDWDDEAVDWSRFDLALLRSTWDYFERLPTFLAWAERVSRQTRLLNPLEVIRWNTDKHYLADLARAGVGVVPSRFIEPGADAASAVDRFLQSIPHPPSAPSPASGGRENRDVVVKPAVGAGSRDAQRHARDNRDAIVAHVQRLLDKNRSVLLQPYLDRVDEHGETALLFFDGVFSHAIRKGPLLKRGEGSTTGLYAEETIEPRTPSADELAVAQRALAAIPFEQPLLYARVDLIRDDSGAPRLLELELVEPSVFVAHADGVAERFTRAIMRQAVSR
jgi:O-ureido-D-serine cyclo-ligase